MKMLVIDGNSILNRAFYGIKMLTNKNGVFTNALLGFMNIYFKNADAVKPDFVAVAFDLKAPTFRHKAVASYKANRKGMPPGPDAPGAPPRPEWRPAWPPSPRPPPATGAT